MVEQLAGLAVRVGEDVVPVLGVEQALVDMHGAARLIGHGLGHEGGIHAVAQRRLAQGTLEHHHLIGKGQGVAMLEVDFHLAGALLVDQGVEVQVHGFAVVVHLLEQRVELVDRIDGEGLAATLLAAGATDRRLQRVVGIGIGLDQVELHFRRDHRRPAAGGVELQHPL